MTTTDPKIKQMDLYLARMIAAARNHAKRCAANGAWTTTLADYLRARNQFEQSIVTHVCEEQGIDAPPEEFWKLRPQPVEG